MTNKLPQSLDDWLQYIERQHPRTIALGLERVLRVKRALAFERAAPAFPVIVVGGTNGKGSCCAFLEAILQNAGYRVGCYTSPHLLRYNERVHVNGIEASDAVLCRAFAHVEMARFACGVPLTYFEFGTLAAMQVFAEARVDVAILEVGLGGRLDAVNAFDADVALVTSVDIDHVDYLGDTREAIGYEKAGVFRARRPAICADHDPPRSLLQHAQTIGAQLYLIDRDFSYAHGAGTWTYKSEAGVLEDLVEPALRGDYQVDNAAACVAVLETLRARLPTTKDAINAGLRQAQVAGRFQVFDEHPQVILDVAHNPHAARALAANLSKTPAIETHAVFSMLADKDIAGVIAALRTQIQHWHVAPSTGARGASAERLMNALQNAGLPASNVFLYTTVEEAYRAAHKRASGDDRIVVFGSFLTVAAVMRARNNERQRHGEIT